MKEDPEQLGSNLTKMVTKLKQVKKQKETELTDKKKNLERCLKTVKHEKLVTLRNDAQNQKIKADD